MRKDARGFTLVEVMITVAIIGILAAIAIPGFRQYQLKSKTGEAYSIMAGIRVLQESFIGTNDNYANIAGPNPLGAPSAFKRPWNNVPCPAGCSRLNPAVCTQFDCIGFIPAGDTAYSFASPSIAIGGGALNEYAIGSLSDLDTDGFSGGYSYQSANTGGVVGYVLDGVSPCIVFIPAGNLIECSPGQF